MLRLATTLELEICFANGHSVASAWWSQSMCGELPGAAFHPPTLLLFLLRLLGAWAQRVPALPAATPTEWELSLFVEHLGVLLFAGSLLTGLLCLRTPSLA